MDSAALTLMLFSHGWLYFDSLAITWDGTHHTIPAPEINGTHIMDIITFVNGECGPGADLNDVCAKALKGMQAVAEADALRIARSDVRPSLLNLMPEGDVTGISLVSLLGTAGLWSVEQTGADSYAISCDEQLATGIPDCERMLVGVVDALRAVDASLCGEASYTFLHTSGAELPEPVDGAESADEPAVDPEPEPEVEPEVETEAEPEPEVEVEAGPEPIGVCAKEPTAIVCDGMRIDLRTRLVHVFDREVQLYRREFELLVLLARNPESTYSTASIRDALDANCELNSINMYVGLVRSKIGDDPNYPHWVATVEGGYRFVGKNPKLVYEEEAEVQPIEHWRSANDGRLLVIDRLAEAAAVDGEPANLTKKEFAILSALTSRQGGVWENEELSQFVLGVGFVESSRTLSTYMNKIRAALGDSPKSTSWIKTVRGVGYRMIGALEPIDQAAHASSNDNSPIAPPESNAAHDEVLEACNVAPAAELKNVIETQSNSVIEVAVDVHPDTAAPLPESASQPEPVPPCTASSTESAFIACDELLIDLTACSASIRGQNAELSPHEYSLLVQLATHAGFSLTRETLVEMAWGKDANVDTRIVDTHIKNLRAKLGDDAAQPRYIKTVHGYGYRFIANIDQSPHDPADPVNIEVEIWRSQNDERVLTVNHTAHLVEIDGDEIALTMAEYEALAFLSGRQGQECESEEMALAVLGATSEKNSRGLASHIKNLRAKLNDNARNPSWIKTVHGKGYQMTGTLLSEAKPMDASNAATESNNPKLESDQAPAPESESDFCLEPEAAPTLATEPDSHDVKNAERLTTKAANEREAMMSLEFPEFPQELLAVEPDIHTHASRYAVALYVIARVVPEGRPFTLVQLRRIVRPYLLSAGLKRLSIPTLSAACRELSARGLGSTNLDSDGEIAIFRAQRLTAQDALRIAMEFDTLGAFDPALSTAAVDADVRPEPVPEPEAVPAPELEAEPEPVAEPVAEPAPVSEIDPATLSKLEDTIAEVTRKLAALDPKPLQDKLGILTQERAGLGFFKFSAKKQLDQKIAAVERELAELKSRDSERHELKTLLDDYTKQRDDLSNAR